MAEKTEIGNMAMKGERGYDTASWGQRRSRKARRWKSRSYNQRTREEEAHKGQPIFTRSRDLTPSLSFTSDIARVLSHSSKGGRAITMLTKNRPYDRVMVISFVYYQDR